MLTLQKWTQRLPPDKRQKENYRNLTGKKRQKQVKNRSDIQLNEQKQPKNLTIVQSKWLNVIV